MASELPVIGELKSHAVRYAQEGFEVFPVDARTKQPMAAHVRGAPSQYGATTDPDVVAGWWDRWPDALIGHRLPDEHIILDIDPRHGGADTWRALKAHFGIETPQTRLHVSGRNDGGGHMWFLRPAEKLTISKLDDWAREHGTGHAVLDRDGKATDHWVCGLDLLHRNHRYTILPPSPHPETLQPYRWHQWADVTEAHPAIVGLLVDDSPPPPPYVPKEYDGDSIADWYSAKYGVGEILHRHGWHLRSSGSGDADGARWQHPTATSPVSATVRHGCLFVYSPNTSFDVTAPGDPHGYTAFSVFAELDHRGDLSAAARAARELKGPDERRPTPAVPDFNPPPPPQVDPETGEVLPAPEAPQTPQVAVYWSDDETDPPDPIDELVTNLIGRGELTVIGAPRAMGKTWATMQLAGMCDAGTGRMFGSPLLEVTQPATVVYLQGELGRSGSYGRWRLATNGKPPHVAEVFDRLRVRVTTTRTTQTVDGITTADEYSHAVIDHRLEPLLAELGCDLLILDPWATYYSGNENSNDETEAAIDALTQMVRRVDCAGWIVHHITAKATHGNLAEPEDLWRGASRLADAVATRVTMLPHYTPTKAKELGMDRFAARRFGDVHVLQRNGPPIPVVHTQLEGFRWGPWDPPEQDSGRPAEFHQKDLLDAIRDAGGSVESKRKLVALAGRSNTAVDRVLAQVIHLGLVEEFTGPRNSIGYRLTDEPTP